MLLLLLLLLLWSSALLALLLLLCIQVKFVMSDETNLNDLLQLNLHNFEDEVRGIVDKASKELNMEKASSNT